MIQITSAQAADIAAVRLAAIDAQALLAEIAETPNHMTPERWCAVQRVIVTLKRALGDAA